MRELNIDYGVAGGPTRRGTDVIGSVGIMLWAAFGYVALIAILMADATPVRRTGLAGAEARAFFSFPSGRAPVALPCGGSLSFEPSAALALPVPQRDWAGASLLGSE
jgi:hypothetical protein